MSEQASPGSARSSITEQQEEQPVGRILAGAAAEMHVTAPAHGDSEGAASPSSHSSSSPRYDLLCPSGTSRVQECLYTHMVLHPSPELGRYSILSSRAGDLLLTQLGPNWRSDCGLGPDVKLLELVRQGAARLFTVADTLKWNKQISISPMQHGLLEAAEQRWGGRSSSSSGTSEAAAADVSVGVNAVRLALARHMIGFYSTGLGFHCLSLAQAHQAVSKFLGPDWQHQHGPGYNVLDIVSDDSCFELVEQPNCRHSPYLELKTARLLNQHGSSASGTSVTAATHSNSNGSSSGAVPVSPGTAGMQAAAAPPAAAAAPEQHAALRQAISARLGAQGARSPCFVLASHLASNPDPDYGPYSTSGVRAGQLLHEVLGRDWRFLSGGRQAVKIVDLLQQEGGFLIEQHAKNLVLVRLDVDALLAAPARPPGMGHTLPPPPAAAAAGGTPTGSHTAGLLGAIRSRWPPSVLQQQPLRILAEHMALHPDPDIGPYSITSIKAGPLLCGQLGPDWRAAAGLGSTCRLKALLQADEAFIVEPMSPPNVAFRLNVGVLLGAAGSATAAAAAAGGGARARSSPSPRPTLAAAAGAGRGAGSRGSAQAAAVLRALQQRWGQGDSLHQALLQLAQHMAQDSYPHLGPCSMPSSETGQVLRGALGADWKAAFGGGQVLAALRQQPEFVVEPWKGPEYIVRLNLGLLTSSSGGLTAAAAAAAGGAAGFQGSRPGSSLNVAAGRNTPPPPAPPPPPPPAAAAGAGASRGPAEWDTALLRALQQRWGHGSPTQQALLLLAQHMVHKPCPELGPYSITSTEAGQALRSMLGDSWKRAFGSLKLVVVLQQQPEFALEAWRSATWAVRLNLGLLLQDAAAAGGGGFMHTGSSSSYAHFAAASAGMLPFEVLAAVNAFWNTGQPIQQPYLRLAQHLAMHPDPVLGHYSISSDGARALLHQQLGGSWRVLAGYDKQDPLHLILEGEGGFVVTQQNQGWCFRLDLDLLLGSSRAAAAAAAAASNHGGSSHSRRMQEQAGEQRRASSNSEDDSDGDLLMLLGVASSGWVPGQQQGPHHEQQQMSSQQQYSWLEQYSGSQHLHEQQQQQQPHQVMGQQVLLEPFTLQDTQQQQQQQQHTQPANGNLLQPLQQPRLLAAIKQRYGVQGGTDRVKAALAYHLVKAPGDSQYGQPPHSVLFLEIDRVLKGALGPGWMQRWGVTDSSLQHLLQEDPAFAGVALPDGRWAVQLQVGQLLQWQQQQQQQQVSQQQM